MSQLHLMGVSFRHPQASDFEMKRIDLTLTPGLYYLYGANGSGKTTLLKGVAGILSPSEGSIRLLRSNQTLSIADYKRYMGYSPQDIALHHRLTIQQYLKYVARMRLIPEDLIVPRIEELMITFGLAREGNRKSGLLSVGQKKRLMLVQAMLADPALLLLDEPFAYADIEEQESLRRWMVEEGERRIIIAAHQPTERYADRDSRILFLLDGRLYGPYAPDHLLDELHDHVVSCRLPRATLPKYEKIIESQGARVISIKNVDEQAIVRIGVPFAKRLEGLDFRVESPTMEDVYMCFGMLYGKKLI